MSDKSVLLFGDLAVGSVFEIASRGDHQTFEKTGPGNCKYLEGEHADKYGQEVVSANRFWVVRLVAPEEESVP